MTTRDDALRRDAVDPLGSSRDLFDLPDGVIYLDGNSLGAQTHAVRDATDAVLSEWADQLIGGWRDAGWWALPAELGAALSPIVGAAPHQLVVSDTVTVNLYKVLGAALELRPDRPVVLIEETSFPTDMYVTTTIARRWGREVRVVPTEQPIVDHLDDQVGVAVLNHIDFRTGALLDMASVTAEIHDVGALAVWDLSHTAGVVPVGLDACDVDFAVGCTYKYLNGGPGAPAYLYVNQRHLAETTTPIPGWLGHADPFLMATGYEPDPGIRRFLTGTHQVVSMRVLAAALDAYDGVDIALVRDKSVQLTDLFIELIDERCSGLGLELVTPRDPDRRGGQVSVRHPDAPEIYERLVAAGVRGDFRTPDILRFGLAPLYVSFTDVWDAVETIRVVLEES